MNQNQVNPKKIKAAGRIIRDQLILAVIAIPASVFIFKGAAGLAIIIGVIMLLMTARLSYLLMTCDEEEIESVWEKPVEKKEPIRKRKTQHSFLSNKMYKLTNKISEQIIGTISGDQLQFLVNHLEEENLNDKDYWLHRSLLDTFKENGADSELLQLLTEAFGDNDELEVVWETI
jgi:hypothetical protein